MLTEELIVPPDEWFSEIVGENIVLFGEALQGKCVTFIRTKK